MKKRIYSSFSALLLCFWSCVSFAQTPCVDGFAGAYPCDNVDLLADIPLSAIGGGANTNDIWGWVSPLSGKEYAIVGCNNGTAFLDVSNPVTPIYLGLLPTHTSNSLWRDMETYNNYCFIVSEANFHGLQVFDLLQLDNVNNPPVDFDESAHYDGFGHCHTLSINTQSGFAYCSGTSTFSGGLHIVNIQNPLEPVLAGGFDQDGYTHDCFVMTYDGPDAAFQGKELVFACNEDELTIVDCTDKSDCQQINSYSYDQVGYVHQGWISKDKSHFMINDELDEQNLSGTTPTGTRTHLFDISSIDDAIYLGFYESTSPSIDHNLYVLDQFVYESNYRSGLRILDAVHVSNGELNEVGFFDIIPSNDLPQFSGTWSNYPYLPSGINLISNMYVGFVIVKPNVIALSQSKFDICGLDQISFEVHVNSDIALPLIVAVDGLPGALVAASPITAEGSTTVTISGLNSIVSGTYNATVLLQTNFGEQYELLLQITKSSGSPASPSLITPANGAFVSNTAVSEVFEWVADGQSSGYIIQIASDIGFTSIIETQEVVLSTYLLNFNLPDGTYYWRVRGANECGTGDWSLINNFQVTIVGIVELKKTNVAVFPNPASQVIRLEGLIEGLELRIVDLLGREVYHALVQNDFRPILDISHLQQGSYLIMNGTSVVMWTKI